MTNIDVNFILAYFLTHVVYPMALSAILSLICLFVGFKLGRHERKHYRYLIHNYLRELEAEIGRSTLRQEGTGAWFCLPCNEWLAKTLDPKDHLEQVHNVKFAEGEAKKDDFRR